MSCERLPVGHELEIVAPQCLIVAVQLLQAREWWCASNCACGPDLELRLALVELRQVALQGEIQQSVEIVRLAYRLERDAGVRLIHLHCELVLQVLHLCQEYRQAGR